MICFVSGILGIGLSVAGVLDFIDQTVLDSYSAGQSSSLPSGMIRKTLVHLVLKYFHFFAPSAILATKVSFHQISRSKVLTGEGITHHLSGFEIYTC